MQNNRKKIAIIGCGNIAQRHANAAKEFGELVAVCDTDIAKATLFAAKNQCQAFAGIEKMLATITGIDIISVCSPNWLHSPQTLQALEYGAHVICEKPMSISSRDAETMVAASKKYQQQLFVVKQLRHYPAIAALKKLIDSNALGNIFTFQINCFWNRPNEYYKDWKGLKDKDGGTLYTQFSHYIDLVLWLFGDVAKVHHQADNYAHPDIEFEDAGFINFKMQSGVIGAFAYSVNADKQSIENSITVYTSTGCVQISGSNLDIINKLTVPGLNKEDLSSATIFDKDKSHYNIYEHAIQHLNGHPTPVVLAEESMSSIYLIESIYQSTNK